MKRSSVIIVLIAFWLSLCQADVQQRRRYPQQLQQQQQQQQQQQGYNYQPARLEQIAQPSRTYGAPQPQQLYRAPVAGPAPAASSAPARLQAKPARLVANSEAQEDIDDAAEEVEVPKAAAPAVPVAPPAPVAPVAQPSIVYYPAGAVRFVQPTAFAKFITAPQPASIAAATPAAYVAAPQYYAAYYG